MTTPDRWQQIESLYHQAVAIPDGGRGEFLDQACADDALLRQEVESLLAYDSQAAVFLETPPDQLAADVLAGQTEALAAGQLVSHYEIVSLLSRGGMGEVYLARDTELNRQVALKLLPQHFSGDAIAVARLEREARAASALNHPGILTIYEFGRDPVGPFIVMEFVEGRTLRELSHKAVALEDVIEWGKQVAQALSEAHRAGIAHRDIKPENIMVRSDGLVKVLDFGLARLSDVVRAEYATVGASGTISGTLSGTLRYMSPEQSRGDTLTPATDIFSLGIVLYELATGLHPFSRDPAVNLLDAIQTRRPVGPASFRPDIPAPLAWLMVWMLDKDPKARPQAVEVAASFRAMAGESKPAPATQQVTRDLGRERSRKLRWTRAVIAATLLFAVALAGFWMWLRDRPTESPAGVTALTSFPGTEYHPSFSPDGEMVAFSWNGPDLDNFDVYLQSIGGTSPVRLTTDPAPDTYPVFSPDGRHVAFRRNRSELYIVAREGGPERKLAVTEGEDVAFTPDGRFLVTNGPIAKDSPTKALWLIPVDGGPPRRITFPPSGVSDVSPRFSPDGTTLAFVRMTPSALSDLYAVQIESSYSANRSTPVRQVTDDGQVEEGLAWAPDGKSLIFASTRAGFGRLWRVPASGGRITPVPEVGIASSYPAVSPVTNRLVYVYQVIDTNLWRLDLDNRGKPGPPKALSGSGWTDASPDVSPDGSRIAFMSNRRGDDNIWVSDTDGHNASQITSFRGSSAGVVGSPKWSPDGTRIAFDARIDGNGDIYVVNASGGEVRRLTSDPTLDVIPNWSRDGRWIYFTTQRTGRPEIWKVSPEGGPEIRVTTNGGFGAQESLDGRILFYTKQRSNAELWQRPVGGGPETAALEAPNAKRYRPFTFAYWSVSEKGIYFLEQVEGPPETATQYRIGFFDFASRDVRQIFTLGRPAQMNAGGLAVSPGGRSILYSQIDSSITDIMLVEGFR